MQKIEEKMGDLITKTQNTTSTMIGPTMLYQRQLCRPTLSDRLLPPPQNLTPNLPKLHTGRSPNSIMSHV